MSHELALAMIGLDTSHTVEFTKRLQDPDCAPEWRVDGMRAATCLRFETPFQSREGLDARQATMEALGVRVTTSLDEALEGCDAILLEINDPAPHLDYFRRVAGLGKPVYIDKPLAATLAEAREIARLAEAHGTRVMSCSNLRFARALVAAHGEVPAPSFAYLHGALGTAPAGSSLVWYGVHVFEMAQRTMGLAARISAEDTGAGITCLLDYPDGRQAMLELERGNYTYRGALRAPDAEAAFTVDNQYLYTDLLREVYAFFTGERNRAPLQAALEVQTLMDAAERALAAGTAVEV